MEHHSERFGALRPDERWMMPPRREVAERAGASIRQDSVIQAAWRRFQPLRRSLPRGRPRAGLFCHRTMTFGYAPGALRGPALGVVEVFLQGRLLRRRPGGSSARTAGSMVRIITPSIVSITPLLPTIRGRRWIPPLVLLRWVR